MRDLGVTAAVVEALPPWVTGPAIVVTGLGSVPVVVALLASLVLADLRAAVRRGGGPLCRQRTAGLVAAVFGGLALVVALKAGFSMPRPPAALAAVPEDGFGFPSGHTMAATVCWGALATWTRISTPARRASVAGLVVALVAISRLVLGVHFLVDVLASVAFGIGYLLVVAYIGIEAPRRLFPLSIGIAVVAVALAGPEGDAALALLGTTLAYLGWLALARFGQPLLVVRDRT